MTGHTQEVIYITRLQLGDAYVPGEPMASWPRPPAESAATPSHGPSQAHPSP